LEDLGVLQAAAIVSLDNPRRNQAEAAAALGCEGAE
jgi:hypothetical protein